MPILYTDLYGNSSSGAATMIGANATANTDGVAGLVPAPLASNATQFLRGDGSWAEAGGSGSSSVVVGATGSADGTAGLVPAPLAANVSQFLRGDGTWANAASVMIGANATANTAGVAGLVPAPTTANATQFLRGDGVWSGPSLIPDETGNSVLSFRSIYYKRTVTIAGQLFNFADVVDGVFQSLTLELYVASGYPGWAGEVLWPGNVEPTFAVGKTHIIVFTTTSVDPIYAASILNY